MRNRSAATRKETGDTSSSSSSPSTPSHNSTRSRTLHKPHNTPTTEQVTDEMPNDESSPLLKSRSSSIGSASNANGVAARPASSWRKPRLLSYQESLRLVPWQTDNDHILSGYRPQLRSIRSCLYSAIGYVHNETVNIHSHSIGAAFFLAMFPLHIIPKYFPTLGVFPGPSTVPPPNSIDKACMACYFVCAVTCLGLSSWFHTVQCCSKGVCDLAHRGDYVGIVVLICGSILPGMYYGFYGYPLLQALYMTGIVAAGLTSGYIVLSPHHRGHRWHRTLTFIALGLSAVVPVTHVVWWRGLAFARQMMGFDQIVLGGASYIFGALLYAARIPESIWPGKFDYFGSSHQIFHGFVLLGAWFQFSALRWMQVGRSVLGV